MLVGLNMDTSTITTVVSLGWDSLLKLMGSVVLSLGGGAAVALFIFHFMADRLAERLKGKYQLELDKKFETYKANIENKKYVTKTKFDAEFDLYRRLSRAYFEMIKYISVMIPRGYATVPADEETRKKGDEEHYDAARKAVVVAQDELNGNAAFIPETFFDRYDEIRRLCIMQLDEFEERWNVGTLVPQREREKISREAYKRTGEINEKFKELNGELRKYLDELDVIE